METERMETASEWKQKENGNRERMETAREWKQRDNGNRENGNSSVQFSSNYRRQWQCAAIKCIISRKPATMDQIESCLVCVQETRKRVAERGW